MTNLIKAVIKNTRPSFEFKSLYKAVLSFLAIVLLVTTTACNSSEVASKTNLKNPPPGKITELYKPITPAVGGMNNYSDVDPRVDTYKVDAQAERLIKQAKDLERKDPNPLQQIKKELDNKGIQERVGDTAEKVSQSAQETADGVAKGTRKGFSNLQDNAKSFKEDVKSAVGDLKQKASELTENIERNTRKNS